VIDHFRQYSILKSHREAFILANGSTILELEEFVKGLTLKRGGKLFDHEPSKLYNVLLRFKSEGIDPSCYSISSTKSLTFPKALIENSDK